MNRLVSQALSLRGQASNSQRVAKHNARSTAMAIISLSVSGLASSLSRTLSLSSHSAFRSEPSSSFLPPASSSSSSSSFLPSLLIEAAHKKGSGSTKNGRDSAGKRLGVKIFGDQAAKAGSIIIRQRGTKFHPGNNVGLGRDYTIFSLIEGVVKFEKFGPDKKKVSVYPQVKEPENPNSRRVRRCEFYRLRRERIKARAEGRELPTLVLASVSPAEDSEEKAIC